MQCSSKRPTRRLHLIAHSWRQSNSTSFCIQWRFHQCQCVVVQRTAEVLNLVARRVTPAVIETCELCRPPVVLAYDGAVTNFSCIVVRRTAEGSILFESAVCDRGLFALSPTCYWRVMWVQRPSVIPLNVIIGVSASA